MQEPRYPIYPWDLQRNIPSWVTQTEMGWG